MFNNILVAVDGSEHGHKAARAAGDLARSMSANLLVLIAYDPLPPYLGQPNLQDAIATRLSLAEDIMRGALDDIGAISGTITKEILEGPAAEAILAIAETRNIDLIIMGTRGLGRLASLLIGSQSQKVVAHASCPVLLVR